MNENYYMNYWSEKLGRTVLMLTDAEQFLIESRFEETMVDAVEQFQRGDLSKHEAMAILDNLEETNDNYRNLVSKPIYRTIDTLISIYTEIIYRINAKKESISIDNK